MKNPFSLLPRAAPRSSRFVALAAALLAIMVGGLVAGLILVHLHSSTTVRSTQPTATLVPNPTQPTATATLPPKPTQTPGSGVPEMLGTIHMFDTTNGWATSNYNNVLRTTDGANHWQDVTPPSIDPPQGPGNLIDDFLSPSLAWVASFVSNSLDGNDAYQGVTKFFHTTDGGQHWSQITMQGYLPTQFIFTDSLHGWLLSDHGSNSGTGNSADVFRTIDGGITWTKVASAGPATGDQPGALPYSGYKMGIGAVNASTAWVTGVPANSAVNFPWLYVTHDGGATWHPQTLSLPANTPSDLLVITGSPIFFNPQDGILPAFFSTTANSPLMYVYVTHDGGATWQSTSIVAADYLYGPGIDFLNVNQGWASLRSLLYVTSDGGQHWTQLPRSSALTDLAGLSFVSNEIGWAIDLSDAGAQLFKTVDGGKTWTLVPFNHT